MYFAMGQKWGMPPYNWDNIANDRFVYLRERLKYAENFYDMYRIDHFVGLFRVWVSPANNDETPGNYMPKDEHLWELHGRKIIDEMINSTSMLPCAEDLGTVPECSYKVLQEYGIPGIDFQRYFKNNFYFKPPSEYRINSCSVVSTHDSTFWINWWQFEAGTIDKNLFELICQSANINYEHFRYAKSVLFDKEPSNHGRLRWSKDISSPEVLVNILQPPQDKTNDFIYLYLNSSHEQEKFLIYLDIYNRVDDNALLHRCLEKINQSNSIFSIQLIQEYLGLDEKLLKKIKRWNYRINTPGKVSKNNWSALLPVSLEGLLGLDVNRSIKKLIIKTGRSQT
jgi:4-alpha-glucanotransferase